MPGIRTCLIALAIVLAAVTLYSVGQANAASPGEIRERPVYTAESCCCFDLSALGWSDKSEDYYHRKWREEDEAWNAKWGLNSGY